METLAAFSGVCWRSTTPKVSMCHGSGRNEGVRFRFGMGLEVRMRAYFQCPRQLLSMEEERRYLLSMSASCRHRTAKADRPAFYKRLALPTWRRLWMASETTWRG